MEKTFSNLSNQKAGLSDKLRLDLEWLVHAEGIKIFYLDK